MPPEPDLSSIRDGRTVGWIAAIGGAGALSAWLWAWSWTWRFQSAENAYDIAHRPGSRLYEFVALDLPLVVLLGFYAALAIIGSRRLIQGRRRLAVLVFVGYLTACYAAVFAALVWIAFGPYD